MNPEVKKKWVEALKSGEYEQGQNFLKVEGKFCCLGVLCDLFAQSTQKGRFAPPSGDFKRVWSFLDSCSQEDQVLPLDVIEWAGLAMANPLVVIDGKRAGLAQHNDEEVPFEWLAKAIEEQL